MRGKGLPGVHPSFFLLTCVCAEGWVGMCVRGWVGVGWWVGVG